MVRRYRRFKKGVRRFKPRSRFHRKPIGKRTMPAHLHKFYRDFYIKSNSDATPVAKGGVIVTDVVDNSRFISLATNYEQFKILKVTATIRSVYGASAGTSADGFMYFLYDNDDPWVPDSSANLRLDEHCQMMNVGTQKVKFLSSGYNPMTKAVPLVSSTGTPKYGFNPVNRSGWIETEDAVRFSKNSNPYTGAFKFFCETSNSTNKFPVETNIMMVRMTSYVLFRGQAKSLYGDDALPPAGWIEEV